MALTKRIGFTRFSRWGENLGRLAVTAATHTEALDGTDELAITCSDEVDKGDRVVWVDLAGKCHEHIVDASSRTHDKDGVYTQATCINSVNETWDDWVSDKRPSGTVAVALASVLEGTRWEVGACDLAGSASRTFYHESVREALTGIVETWGGELEVTVTSDGTSIVSRAVAVRAARGDQESPKRFTWTKDLVDITRAVGSSDVKTRVYGYGKGVETEEGGYGRRLTFGDVNGGVDYVEDAEATAAFGHPGPDGSVVPAVGVYVDEQCEDAATLLQETLDYLERAKAPEVTYTASVVDLAAFGREWEDVGVGDSVAIVDKGFSDSGIRLRGRVSQIERDLLGGDATVTFGTLTDAMADMWAGVSSALKTQQAAGALYDAAAGTSAGWLTQLQSALNERFNSVGTYKVETFELGAVYSNVPLDTSTGLPLKPVSGMWAININGMGLRLASGLTSAGEWDWKTFLTGGTVTADLINAGTMRADRIRAGLIVDEAGRNRMDLDTGEFIFGAYAKKDEAISTVTVEYATGESATKAPDSGWSATTPKWEQGRYVWQRTVTESADGSVSYSDPTCIQGAKGADGAAGLPGKDGTDGRDGADGTDGASSYVHIRYAATPTPGDADMGTEPDAYIGICTTASPSAPAEASAYVWSKWEGKDGTDGLPGKDGTDGADGTPSYVHFAYATSADGVEGFSTTPFDGAVYIGVRTDSTQVDSTSPADYAWSRMRGADGADGTSVTIKGNLASTEELPATGQTGDSYLIDGDLWVWDGDGWTDAGSIQGPKGEAGPQGPAGKDGLPGKDGTDGRDGTDGASSYVHIRYAATPTPGDADMGTEPDAYIGICTTASPSAPSEASAYVWSKWEGRDGDDGLPGKNGSDGTPSYAHFAYATSADGVEGFSTTPFDGAAYIGVCSDSTKADPTDPSAYAWSRMKGEDGEDGADGAKIWTFNFTQKRTTAQIVAYQSKVFSLTTTTSGVSVGDLASMRFPLSDSANYGVLLARVTGVVAPSTEGGSYIVNTLVISASTVVDKVTSVEAQYYLSTSDTAQEGGEWSTEQPAWKAGHYIWTRSEVTYLSGDVYHSEPVLAAAINGANEATDKLDKELDQEGIFNRLTDNGSVQGMFLEEGQLYINGEYIKTGTLVADRVGRGGDVYAEIGEVKIDNVPYVGVKLMDGEKMPLFFSYYDAFDTPQVRLYSVSPNGNRIPFLMSDASNVSIGNLYNVGDVPGAQQTLLLSPGNGMIVVSDGKLNDKETRTRFQAGPSGVTLAVGDISDTEVSYTYYPVYRLPGNAEYRLLQHGYYLARNGTCVTFCIKDGASDGNVTVPGNWGGTYIGTAPVGWRPYATMRFQSTACISLGVYLEVTTDGNIYLYNGSASSFTGRVHVSGSWCVAN